MTFIDLTPGLYLALMVNGLFTGLGAALGTYLANKHIIERAKKIFRRKR